MHIHTHTHTHTYIYIYSNTLSKLLQRSYEIMILDMVLDGLRYAVRARRCE